MHILIRYASFTGERLVATQLAVESTGFRATAHGVPLGVSDVLPQSPWNRHVVPFLSIVQLPLGPLSLQCPVL